MKNRQIKINFIKGIKVTPTETTYKEDVISLNDNTMIRLYERFKGIELQSGDKLEAIIKYFLPSNEEIALNQLKEGIIYNNKKYIPLLTSPNMMKKENRHRKCEYLYIVEDDKDFVELYRKLISLNKINCLYKKDKVVVNKDIIARLSLGLSGSTKIDYNPRIVILPSDTYKYYAEYVTIENGKLIDLPKEKCTKTFEFADGCGFMSPKMADEIQKQMKLDYRVDFAGIRMYNGLATKGVVVRADFNKYFDDNLIETDYFQKREDGYYTLDYFGKWVNISKADLILNTNMCKFAKLWKDENFNDINELINERLENEEFKMYKDILSCLYVTKVNKEMPSQYTRISYQVLNNLALLPKELQAIQKESEDYIKKVIAMDNIKYIKLFMGDIAREEEDELSASTKIHKMLQINENFHKTRIARKTISNLINKSAHDLVCKPFVKGNYKTAVIDPICYLNWIMTRDIEASRELQEGQFFIPKEEGKRVITRNPLAVFSEIHRIELTSTEKLNKYFGDLTSELIFFNQADNTAFISSGEDFDLDQNGVWENDLIYNAVIEPKGGKHFSFEGDGDTKEVKWSKEKEFKCVLKASGNIIGSIANVTTKISNKAQEIGYVLKENGKWLGYEELKEYWLNLDKNKQYKKRIEKAIEQLELLEEDLENGVYENHTKDEIKMLCELNEDKIREAKVEVSTLFKADMIKMIEEGKLIDLENADDETIRKSIIDNFYNLRGIAYEALMWSQVAIDAPKTLIIPNKDDMSNLKDYKEMDYPRFMYFAKYTDNKDSIEVRWEQTKHTRTALNINAKRIYSEVIKEIKALKKYIDDNANDNNTTYIKLLKEVAQEITLDENKNPIMNEVDLSFKSLYKAYNKHKEELRKAKAESSDYNKAKYKAICYLEELVFKYSYEEVAGAIIKVKASTSFITDVCWDVIEYAINSKDRNVTIFKQDKEGEYNWLFKDYKEVECKLKDGKLQGQYKEQLERNINSFTKFNVAGLTGLEALIETGMDLIIKEEVEGKYKNLVIYTEEDKKIGFIYKNSLKEELTDGQIIKAIEWGYGNKNKYIELSVDVA